MTSLRRLHALTGIVALGVFVVVHVLLNATALAGSGTHMRAHEAVYHLPFAGWIIVIAACGPLAFHALQGIALLRAPRSERAYPAARRPIAVLDRIASVLVLAFVVFHVMHVGLPTSFDASAYTRLAMRLSTTRWGIPWSALAYVLGAGATIFHLGAGIVAWRRAYGPERTPEQDKRLAQVTVFASVVLFAIAVLTVAHFATGLRLYTPAPPSAPCGPAGAPPSH